MHSMRHQKLSNARAHRREGRFWRTLDANELRDIKGDWWFARQGWSTDCKLGGNRTACGFVNVDLRDSATGDVHGTLFANMDGWTESFAAADGTVFVRCLRSYPPECTAFTPDIEKLKNGSEE